MLVELYTKIFLKQETLSSPMLTPVIKLKLFRQ